MASQLSFSLSELVSSEYGISIGDIGEMYIKAFHDDGIVVFSHNLGGFDKPSKIRATEMIHAIQQGFFDYCDVNADFRTFMADKKFIAELNVFSGHMDFLVARLCGTDIEWFTELD